MEQIFKGKVANKFEMAQKYYTIVSAMTGLSLTEREIQLVAFTSIHGNISYSTTKEEFISTFNTSSATINNMVSRLKKKMVLVKDGSKVKVNPQLIPDFDSPLTLKIQMIYG